MRFLIISHTLHRRLGKSLYAYAPYVREMNLWLKHVDKVEVVAPEAKDSFINLEIPYDREDIIFNKVPSIAFTSIRSSLNSMIKIPLIFIVILKACNRADHIHLRCPGSIGLIGCLIQIFFPRKTKTVKYAGNWDPNSRQPFSYRIQKSILRSTLLSRNIKVLVYGYWEKQSKNIKSFFTATFKDKDKLEAKERDYNTKLQFLFVGSLVEGKNPFLAIEIIEALRDSGFEVQLKLFGRGVLMNKLNDYVKENNLETIVQIEGSQKLEVIQETLRTAHFLILPSKSEGWPKVIAEAMFFGVIPIATKISCIPYMLDFGKRGLLIGSEVKSATKAIKEDLQDRDKLRRMSLAACKWSQKYTLEAFETEIIKLLK
ncbi:glycosyltransferase [Flavivirga aquimarina]|uniref:Glycosyltransferase n=1 Tax=Flavivirga aquimarina TaxID=2027862 RepID=A0ABT8WBP2_9FLAO|nr:glycosyltransferase [Flavivirga aquimarina]MDO5970548.1 glycosyltransferase [Flavivirga aquimarina]